MGIAQLVVVACTASGDWGPPDDGVSCQLSLDTPRLVEGTEVRFTLEIRAEEGAREQLVDRSGMQVTFTFRSRQDPGLAPFVLHWPRSSRGPRFSRAESLVPIQDVRRQDGTLLVCPSDQGEIPAGDYSVTASVKFGDCWSWDQRTEEGRFKATVHSASFDVTVAIGAREERLATFPQGFAETRDERGIILAQQNHAPTTVHVRAGRQLLLVTETRFRPRGSMTVSAPRIQHQTGGGPNAPQLVLPENAQLVFVRQQLYETVIHSPHRGELRLESAWCVELEPGTFPGTSISNHDALLLWNLIDASESESWTAQQIQRLENVGTDTGFRMLRMEEDELLAVPSTGMWLFRIRSRRIQARLVDDHRASWVSVHDGASRGEMDRMPTEAPRPPSSTPVE